MRRLITLLSLAILVLIRANAAIPDGIAHTVDSLRNDLSGARTAADSLHTLCNLYDLLPREESTAIGDTIIATAMRAGDQSTALDIIRNQANRRIRNDSLLNVLTRLSLACSDGPERRETLTFIRMMSNLRRTLYSDSLERDKTLHSYLEEMSHGGSDNDLYDRIALTHGICLMLSDDPNSEILVSYMDSLSSLMRQLPSTSFSLRNVYNVHAATIFTVSHPEKAMIADMHTLADIEKLKQYYHSKGRIYRNYNVSYYTIYTRLLSNFAALDSARIEEYYNKVIELLPTDPSIQETFNITPAAEIYHAMAHKDYRRALPLLRKVIENPLIRNMRTRLLKYEIECAEALGDKAMLLEATRAYSKALEDALKERTKGSFRELQVAYAIYDLKHDISLIEARRRESEASMQRTVIAISSCALVLLVILAEFLFTLYRKNHRLARRLNQSNLQLQEESENLRKSHAELVKARNVAMKANNLKSDFIKNMSYEVKIPLQAITEYSRLIADCAADSPTGTSGASGRHLSRFADMVELNSELLTTIIDDVLHLSEIESSSLPIQTHVVNLRNIAEATLTGVRHRVKPGVQLSLDPSCGDLDIPTDPPRLQQILNNLLTNAAKFTSEGTITLGYAPDPDGKHVDITVTDTGIGINPESKEKIFERFVKLDHDTQGAGLGLTISRLLARHLGGDLKLDTSYTCGARFVLTLPRK